MEHKQQHGAVNADLPPFTFDDTNMAPQGIPITYITSNVFNVWMDRHTADETYGSFIEFLLSFTMRALYRQSYQGEEAPAFIRVQTVPAEASPRIVIARADPDERKVNGPGLNPVVITADNVDEYPDDAAPGSLPKSAIELAFKGFAANRVMAIAYALIMASQARDLTIDNINSLWNMFKLPAPSARIRTLSIQYATALPKASRLANYELMRNSFPWLRFHTTAVTTATVILEFYANLPLELQQLIPERLIEAARIAQPYSYDPRSADGLDQRLIGHAHCYAVAATNLQLADTWVQGKKAKMKMNPAEVKALITFYRKVVDMTANFEAIQGAVNMNDVIAAGRRSFNWHA